MLLSEMFSDSFGNLPNDVEKHPAVWQEVRSRSLFPPSLPSVSVILRLKP